jgi:hypothetical protein
MTDHRKFTRLPLDVIVEIKLEDGNRLYGETADISLDGAFVLLIPPPGVQSGQSCDLELIIKAEEGWVRVAFSCTVAHTKDDGIGLQFGSPDTPNHESFLKLLIDGSDNIDQILDELSQHPRKKFLSPNK